ncbi:SUR1 protein, putative [Coccidioides posadasii C735 delta SOWgp]|uniref:SUR1 protein, putative n=1 Tax=Coccidioides posadasii (strain C735) TaxID=222929 RepID=C5P220_COCP7|nr:SUR1 protein, putative [Coccidioides posadasii C735 delta SOWgp]EER28923.1 SUR1 protein, putative [Coccidioides posadasii C735 delta SOWgp]|eukprot:XP_003071068.1 SUR1 protein, putative [Coccidioides posadasii C735 delta SOWgp]
MRKGALIFIIANFIVIAFLVNSVSTLLSLLFEDAATDAISRTELPAPNSTFIDQKKPIIPKIIHQTYKNESIPAIWQEAQQSCLELHPDYEYKLWTDEKADAFIESQYPWFLETFRNYRYPIQRADAIRYFVLTYYGGIYIDLDDGCNRRLDPLLVYPAWVRKTSPTGISNDIMGSVPQHPFFRRVIDSLQTYNRHWVLPYITVMYSTGPLFLSVIWKEYMAGRPSAYERVRVMMADEYNRHSWSFFTHHPGSSWHGKDARLIFWMGGHWVLLTVLGFILAGIVGAFLWWGYRRLIVLGSKYFHRYSPIQTRPSGAILNPSRSFSPSRKLGILPAFLQRRSSSRKRDEENALSDTVYELLDRPE